jgi:microcystin synthetase protein McyJ
MRLAEAAALRPSDRVLDVGFGFAEQDFAWLAHCGVAHVMGVNITERQVERARERVQARGLAGRIDLRVGSATQLQLDDASFDKVTALECAHHFDTREAFFAEAFRVLAPGGRLATGDVLPSAGDAPLSLVQKVTLRRWAVPLANMYPRDTYCEKLARAGFVNVKAESIRQYVFPGAVKYETLRNRGVARADASIELSQAEIDACFGLEHWRLTGFTDYVMFSADKPR